MAYTPRNKLKKFKYIIDVYNQVKQEDIPDTRIVANIFPKYGIFISRATWVKIKGMKPSELSQPQLSLF